MFYLVHGGGPRSCGLFVERVLVPEKAHVVQPSRQKPHATAVLLMKFVSKLVQGREKDDADGLVFLDGIELVWCCDGRLTFCPAHHRHSPAVHLVRFSVLASRTLCTLVCVCCRG